MCSMLHDHAEAMHTVQVRRRDGRSKMKGDWMTAGVIHARNNVPMTALPSHVHKVCSSHGASVISIFMQTRASAHWSTNHSVMRKKNNRVVDLYSSDVNLLGL
jgi:hypothetical protein